MEVFENSPLFHSLPGGDIQCLCCQHKCVIPPGKLGRCRARGNIKGKPFSPIWGRYTVAVDPIEKKPLYHFLPGTKVYSYGTVGCNFNCQFCQNSSLSMWKLDIEDVKCIRSSDVGVLEKFTPEEMVEKAIRTGCLSIASTYNEPTISTEFSHEVFKLAKSKGLFTVYVTNGFESVETLNYLGPYLDAVNIDLKSFNEDFYVKVLGGHLKGVCNTIKRCYEMGINTEVTTLVIPDANDSDKELTDIANFLSSISPDIVWHISAYHDDYLFKGRGVTPLKTLQRAADIGHKAGLKYVYMGNISSRDAGITKCPKCGAQLVDRDWFSASISKDFVDGHCKCGEAIPGVFLAHKGSPSRFVINLKDKLDKVPDELCDLDQYTATAAIDDGSANGGDEWDDLVIYATKAGTSKEFAELVGQTIGFSKVIDVASLPKDFVQNALVNCNGKRRRIVFVVATYGRGMPPPSAKEFWEKLSAVDKSKVSNLNLQFAVLGLGSSSFESTFVGFAKNLEAKLLEIGGTEICPLCTRDEMNDEEDDEKVKAWINQIKF